MARPLFGFPASWGQSKVSVFPHIGPSSYAQVTYGPLAAGDLALVAEAGLTFFQNVIGLGMSDTGNFYVYAISVPGSSTNPGASATSVRLKWVAARTAAVGGQNQTVNTEAVAATDLSGETVLLTAIGLG